MSGSNTNADIHEPLTSETDTHHIRLCRLAPATSQEEEIRCELFNTTLEAKEKFEALSYTWGNANDTIPIIINDKPFYVTRNLAVALRHLRHADQQRLMWIDSICINQLDLLEKKKQVQRMKNIYGPGGAQRVVVWLGEIPNVRKAIDFCARMHFCREKVSTWQDKYLMRREERKIYESKHILEQPYDDEAAEYATKQLWAYMEENEYSKDPLTFFWNRWAVYRGLAETDRANLAKFQAQGNSGPREPLLIDSLNTKRSASEAARFLWNRMREPNECQDDEPILEPERFNEGSEDIITLFSSRVAADDPFKYLRVKRDESSPGKDVWDLIQQNKDTRQAARLLWEKISESMDSEVVLEFYYELFLEHQEENEACKHIFLDAPWWSRVWILQEVIHSGEVVVLLEQEDSISFEELLAAYDNWNVWKQLYRGESAFGRKLTFYREWKQQFERKDVDTFALASAWAREQQAELYDSQLVGFTEQDMYRAAFGSTRTWADPRGHFTDLRGTATGVMRTNKMYPPNFSGLILDFRNQLATDGRDKVYALLGMAAAGSNGADITVDYQISTEKLYIITARALLKKVLLILLIVESPQRAIPTSRNPAALPSWVPDYRTTQNSFPQYQMNMSQRFSADAKFPPVEQEPRFRQAPDAETLIVRGLYVGVVTSTFDARLTDEATSTGLDAVRLITYDQDPAARYKTASELATTRRDRSGSTHGWDRPEPVKDSSWGPVHAEVGDSIIIVAGLSIPIVVRRVDCGSELKSGGKYLFVGSCWLVDSRLDSKIFLKTDWNVDSGFSPIMFGSALKNLSSDWIPEEFTLC